MFLKGAQFIYSYRNSNWSHKPVPFDLLGFNNCVLPVVQRNRVLQAHCSNASQCDFGDGTFSKLVVHMWAYSYISTCYLLNTKTHTHIGCVNYFLLLWEVTMTRSNLRESIFWLLLPERESLMVGKAWQQIAREGSWDYIFIHTETERANRKSGSWVKL